MNSLLRKILQVAALLMLLPGVAQAQDETPETKPKINVGVETDVTRYVWRGLAYSRAPIEMTKLWITAGRWTVAAVGILNHQENHIGQFKEIDLVVATTHEWKKLRVEPSLSYYRYYRRPSQSHLPSTSEAAVKFSYPVGHVRVFTNQIVDVLRYHGYFGQVGTTYERSVTERLSLSSAVTVGWASSKFNQTYVGVQKRAWNVVETQVALTYAVNRRMYVRPHFEYTRMLDQQLRRNLPTPTIANLGVAVGFNW